MWTDRNRASITKRGLSRRDVGRLAAGLVGAPALPLRSQVLTPSSYVGPLTGIESGLDDRRFDPVAYAHDRLRGDAIGVGFQPCRMHGDLWWRHGDALRCRARTAAVESGEKDNIFPIHASIESFNKVRDIYGVFDAADRNRAGSVPRRTFLLGQTRHSIYRTASERINALGNAD